MSVSNFKNIGLKIIERKKRNSGFTLLEVMVALSIIAIALVAVYKLYAQTLSMNESLMFNTHAPILAQKKMAEFFLLSPDELTDNSGDFGDEFKNYSWKALVEPVTSDLLGDMAEDFKRIDLIVSFNNNEQSYRLRTYRFEGN